MKYDVLVFIVDYAGMKTGEFNVLHMAAYPTMPTEEELEGLKKEIKDDPEFSHILDNQCAVLISTKGVVHEIVTNVINNIGDQNGNSSTGETEEA